MADVRTALTLPRNHADPGSTRPSAQVQSPSYDGLDDRALVGLVRERDGLALEVLFARYSRPCFGLARRVLADEQFAQDVVQEVFLALWRDPSRFDATRGGFSTWLLSVTHHKAVDAVRREEGVRKRRAGADALEHREDDARGVEDEVWASWRGERLRAALLELPKPQREALSLAYFGGHTQREIAQLTTTPLGTVKTRMLAGMRTLRQALDGLQDGTPAPGPRRPGVRP